MFGWKLWAWLKSGNDKLQLQKRAACLFMKSECGPQRKSWKCCSVKYQPKEMTGREQGRAGDDVNPQTQMLHDCHIFSHTTLPELWYMCRVILQVQWVKGDKTQTVEGGEREEEVKGSRKRTGWKNDDESKRKKQENLKQKYQNRNKKVESNEEKRGNDKKKTWNQRGVENKKTHKRSERTRNNACR